MIHAADEMRLNVYFWAFDDANTTIGATVGSARSSGSAVGDEDAASLAASNLTSNASGLGQGNELASDQWRVLFLNRHLMCENRERGFKTQFGLWEGK